MSIAKELYKLLNEKSSGTQKELVDALTKRGISATQSSVSRALRKIGAVKEVEEDGTVKYSLLSRQKNLNYVESFLGDLVLSIKHNGQNIVLRTHKGAANAVAQFIDDKEISNTLGTLAGDDTILIIPQDIKKIEPLVQELNDFLFGE